jgi:hypothetical protein
LLPSEQKLARELPVSRSAPNRESLTVEWASLYEIVTTAREYRCAVPRMTVPQAAARRR